LIAEHERKFPSEVLPWGGIKSVTAVTKAFARRLDCLGVNYCFLLCFGGFRAPAVNDLRSLSPKLAGAAKMAYAGNVARRHAGNINRRILRALTVWLRGGTVVRCRFNEIGVAGALAIAVALGGCANVDENKDVWFSKPFQVVSRNAGYTFSELQESKDRSKPITANDLVAANGSCPPPPMQQAAAPPVQAAAAAAQQPGAAPAADQPGNAPAAGDTGTLLGGGIALGMSECDVVFRAGAANNVQIGKNPNGDRTAVLTYNSGPRPGIYHFDAGKLTEIERVQTAPAPAQTAKKKPASPKASSKQAAKE
jgi:hypothetical protein